VEGDELQRDGGEQRLQRFLRIGYLNDVPGQPGDLAFGGERNHVPTAWACNSPKCAKEASAAIPTSAHTGRSPSRYGVIVSNTPNTAKSRAFDVKMRSTPAAQ
jgi:hypothetical protein